MAGARFPGEPLTRFAGAAVVFPWVSECVSLIQFAQMVYRSG